MDIWEDDHHINKIPLLLFTAHKHQAKFPGDNLYI